jgi:hypothetical protein
MQPLGESHKTVQRNCSNKFKDTVQINGSSKLPRLHCTLLHFALRHFTPCMDMHGPKIKLIYIYIYIYTYVHIYIYIYIYYIYIYIHVYIYIYTCLYGAICLPQNRLPPTTHLRLILILALALGRQGRWNARTPCGQGALNPRNSSNPGAQKCASEPPRRWSSGSSRLPWRPMCRGTP